MCCFNIEEQMAKTSNVQVVVFICVFVCLCVTYYKQFRLNQLFYISDIFKLIKQYNTHINVGFPEIVLLFCFISPPAGP